MCEFDVMRKTAHCATKLRLLLIKKLKLICIIFLEFPLGCVRYRGPNPEQCYGSIWMSSDCREQGWDNPINNDTYREMLWDTMNLRCVLCVVFLTYRPVM